MSVRDLEKRLLAFIAADEEQDPIVVTTSISRVTAGFILAQSEDREHFMDGLDMLKSIGVRLFDTTTKDAMKHGLN